MDYVIGRVSLWPRADRRQVPGSVSSLEPQV